MRLKKTAPLLTALLISVSALVVTPQAKAYDEDTHFYATYAMARYSGIRHEVAAQIALSAQWMDGSYISDPTSLIFMPITGIKTRRLGIGLTAHSRAPKNICAWCTR